MSDKKKRLSELIETNRDEILSEMKAQYLKSVGAPVSHHFSVFVAADTGKPYPYFSKISADFVPPSARDGKDKRVVTYSGIPTDDFVAMDVDHLHDAMLSFLTKSEKKKYGTLINSKEYQAALRNWAFDSKDDKDAFEHLRKEFEIEWIKKNTNAYELYKADYIERFWVQNLTHSHHLIDDVIDYVAQKETIRVLVVEPGRTPKIENIPPDIEVMQKIVGGNIEMFSICPDDQALLVLNKDRNTNGSPRNRALRNETGKIFNIVSGTFFVIGTENKDEFVSLSEHLKSKYSTMFAFPERFYQHGDGDVQVVTAYPHGADEQALDGKAQ